MKIYTRSGDKGRTSLATGQRVSKSDLRLETYGTVDELNSFVGWLRSNLQQTSGEWRLTVDVRLGWIQNRLFDIGAIMAGADIALPEGAVSQLERWIDEMQDVLPELRAFILPGGADVVSLCHVCRTVTRRLERSMVLWHENTGDDVAVEVWQFVNRLSDYCFVLARFMAHKLEITVPTWEKC